MRTLQTEILSGHDGILPTGDTGPATGRLNQGTFQINIDTVEERRGEHAGASIDIFMLSLIP